MRDLPPLNALRAFEAAARRGSFQAAADELHVSATAISHHIRHLEELLKQPLFIRHPRPIRLTAAGQKLFPALRDGLDQIGAGVAAVRAASTRQPLVITTTPAFASRWLIPRLGEINKALNGGRVAVLASETVADLHSGEADLAIRYTRSPPDDFACHHLFEDHYQPFCHPRLLAGTAQARVLLEYPLIHFQWKQKGVAVPDWSRWLDSARQLRPDVALPLSDDGIHFSEETHAIEAAVMGQGVALLSDQLVARELQAGMLVPAVDHAISGLAFYVIHTADNSRRGEIEAFIEQLFNAL
ncbi:LysR substrate-binding domain-containing protein [Gammaproteobacteria bacterium AB-CW1]|uniref:LysR substrate-binding domain-containing protein n=1 Tax=Natronospira elongata TaxID=3110268 RepID=A0AAP6MMJ7_9GAMM|nr:LysR substrate-binding domain-containing protein [Gammaproteobacteria bacterium AB-CW1]